VTKLTSYQRVADALLQTKGTTLPIVILDAVEAGESYDAITRRLRDMTDGAVEVTSEAVRKWHRQFSEQENAA